MIFKTKISSIEGHVQQAQGDVFWQFQEKPAEQTTLIYLAALKPANAGNQEAVLHSLADIFFQSPSLPVESLDTRLSFLNHELSVLFPEKNLPSTGQLSCVVAKIENSELAVAALGDSMAGLVRNDCMINLYDRQSSPEGVQPRFPLFSFGKLEAEDKIIVALKSLFNYVNPDRLTSLVASYPVHEAARLLKQITASSPEPILALLIELQAVDEPKDAGE